MNRHKLFTVFLLTLLALMVISLNVASVFAQGVHIRGTVWVSPAEQAALDDLTALYQETHPDVTVEWISVSGGGPYGRDKVQTMLAGGDIPDFMMLNTGQFEALAARNQLLPLDDLVASTGLDLSIFWPQAITGSTFNGTLYGLPRDMSNVIMYYNKDLFDAAGVEYPTEEWTWDDMFAAAQALTLDTTGDGQIDQWGIGIDNVVWQWDGFVQGNGGQVLSDDRSECTFTNPQAVEGIKFWFELMSVHGVSPTPGALPEQAGAGDWFQSQAIAMAFFGPWYRPGLVNMDEADKFNWDVAYPPRSPNTGEHGSVVYVDQWGIAALSQQPEATFDFVTFLTSEAGQTRFTELLGSRSISPVQSVAESEEWLNYGGSTGEIILDSLSFSQPPPVNFGNAPEAENIWDQELSLVVAGESTVEDALANICPQLEPILPEPAA